jgi:hypothetical protein
MKKEEILKKAIEKAVKNGWVDNRDDRSKDEGYHHIEKWHWDRVVAYGDYIKIIFDHSFAKAFWGEETLMACPECDKEINFSDREKYYSEYDDGYWCDVCNKDIEMGQIPIHFNILGVKWQYHIQQLALSEDRLEYISRFL